MSARKTLKRINQFNINVKFDINYKRVTGNLSLYIDET